MVDAIPGVELQRTQRIMQRADFCDPLPLPIRRPGRTTHHIGLSTEASHSVLAIRGDGAAPERRGFGHPERPPLVALPCCKTGTYGLGGFSPTHTYALFSAWAVSALRWHSLAGVPEPCV
jgi:hypothetical protein